MKPRNKNKKSLHIALPILTVIGVAIITVISGFYEETWIFDWTDIRKEVKDSVRVTERRNYLTSGYIGEVMSRPDQYYTRKWITENATPDELLKLTEYPNGVVKAIAYEGLLENKNFNQKKALILKSISDTSYTISYGSGCIIGMKRNIDEYLIQNVLKIDTTISPPPPFPNGRKANNFGLNDVDKKEILLEYYKSL